MRALGILCIRIVVYHSLCCTKLFTSPNVSVPAKTASSHALSQGIIYAVKDR